MTGLFHRIAQELNAQPQQVQAAAALLDEGATVPFIARYRKEVTGGQALSVEIRFTLSGEHVLVAVSLYSVRSESELQI